MFIFPLELAHVPVLERILPWYFYYDSINYEILFILLSMQMNAKVVLSRLFQSFKLSLPKNYELVVVQRGIIQPKDDVECVLENRQA